ncbi:MAG: YadA C-terminal domain-containing protein, partial [Leclercia sp.]
QGEATTRQAQINKLTTDKVDVSTYNAGKTAQAAVDVNQQNAIDSNAKAVTANTTAIGTAQTSIQTNAGSITANTKIISANTQGVANNTQNINSNAAGINTNAVSIGANKQSIDANSTAIANKVETTTFTADQQRQDALISGKADATQVQANRRAIADEATEEHQHFTTLQAGVQQAKDTGAYAQSRADAAYANTEANQKALVATNQKVADHTAELANHEQRIETLEQNSSANFSKLKNDVDQNRKRASAGISGVAAMANIPQVIESQTFNVGAGVGTTDGESALAVGFSARAAQSVVVKASVSNDTQHNFVVGGGVAVGW